MGRKQPPAIIEANQKQIVSEILKRNPNILKGKNEVKVKVVVKDKEGKSKTETIVLRSQAYVPLEKRFPQEPRRHQAKPRPNTTQQAAADRARAKALKAGMFEADEPQPLYTGKPGRPKMVDAKGKIVKNPNKVKQAKQREPRLFEEPDGSEDPRISLFGADANPPPRHNNSLTHNKAGEKIMVEYATLSDDLRMVVQDTTGQQYKILEEPSSEAESLSHVASGIAMSLGAPTAALTTYGAAKDKKVITKTELSDDWDS